jgi:hypothetical protein
MEQRDLIKDQIEQLGKVLGKILAEFFGMKSNGKIEEGIEVSNENFAEKLDLEIEKLLNLSIEESSIYLSELKLNAEHIDLVTDYLIEMAKYKLESDKSEAKKVLLKILQMFEISDNISQTVPFDRMTRIANIDKMLLLCN